VPFQTRRDHDLNYYIGIIQDHGLVTTPQLNIVQASVQTITISGVDMNYLYPELDPSFFARLPKSESEKKANAASEILGVARTVVH